MFEHREYIRKCNDNNRSIINIIINNINLDYTVRWIILFSLYVTVTDKVIEKKECYI